MALDYLILLLLNNKDISQYPAACGGVLYLGFGASMQGKSIKGNVLNQILPISPDEEMAWHELETLLGDRVKSENAGKISQKSVKETFQEVSYNWCKRMQIL